ncbi:MAG: hypothetical protein J6V57_02135 [Spirochaetaceae bacterium]|nr:hypothetical protein [Spirochaetaceae bacterium]
MFRTTFISMILVFCLVFSSCLTTKEASDSHSAQEQNKISPTDESLSEGAEVELQVAEEPELPPPPVPDLSLQAGKTPAAIRVGQNFAIDFTATVINQDTESAESGITVTVTYPVGKDKTEISFATTELTTDDQGQVSFTPPDTSFTCNSEITFSVESKDGKKVVSIPYIVKTNRHNKGGNIAIVDYGLTGNPIRDNSRSASALLTALIRNGFSSIGNVDFVNEVHSGDQAKIYQAAYNLIGNNSNFLIYGTVKYNGEVTEKDGIFYTPLIGDITCLEMETGKELFHTVIEVVGEGSSEWAALQNARMDLFGPQAAEALIHGM